MEMEGDRNAKCMGTKMTDTYYQQAQIFRGHTCSGIMKLNLLAPVSSKHLYYVSKSIYNR